MIMGDELTAMKVESPLMKSELGFVVDDEIRPRVGTAINPVCPGHYIDDMRLA